MGTPLRVLIVEDSDDDAKLLLREIRRGGFEPRSARVDTPEAMRAALEAEPWDVVTSEYVMPRFSGPAALELFRKTGLDIPFIVVSGRVEEETAVEMLKAGAHDFVAKGRLSRLVPAINRELREAQTRHERKLAQAQRDQIEARFQTLARVSPAGIFQTDADGGCRYVNERWCELAGISADQAAGRGWLAAVHPEDRERIGSEWYACAGERQPFEAEYRFKRLDGRTTWVLGRAAPELGAGGEIIGWVGSITDVTRMKDGQAALSSANLALRQSEERLKEAQGVSRLGSWTFDVDSEAITWSEEMYRVFGRDPATLPPTPAEYAGIFAPASLKRIKAAHERSLRDGTAFELNLEIVTPAGNRWVALRGLDDRDAAGRVVRTHGTAMDITEHKRAEDALQRTVAELKEAQRVAHMGSWRLDNATNEVVWTEEIHRMLGLDPRLPAPPYTEHYRLFTPESYARLSAALRHTLAVDAPYELDLEMVRADGTRGWMLARGELVRDESGRVAGVRGTAMDITERKHAEQALEVSRARFRALTENSSDLIVVLDAEGTLRYASPALVRITGWEDEELIGKPLGEFVHPRDLPAMAAGMRRIMEDPGTPHAAELRYRHKNGDWIVLASVAKNAIADPAVRGIVVNARDVTEGKRAEEAIRISRDLLRSVVEHAPIRVFWKDSELRYLGCNSLFARDAGLARPEDLLGKDDSQLGWREQAEVYRADDRRVMDSDTPKLGYEEPQTTPDGRTIWLRTSKVPLHDAGGKVFGMLGIYDDVTGHKQAEDRIRRLNRVYSVLSRINGAIVRIRDSRELFEEACRIAVEAGGFVMAWSGKVDRDAGVVRPLAWAGKDVRSFLDAAPLALVETTPGSPVLVGRAVLERQLMVSNDVAGNPQRLMEKECAERGIKSLAVLPLMLGQEAVGVLALYAAEIGFFDEEELVLLRELASDISFALDYMSKADKVNYLAYYDVLTGLPNRALLLDRLAQYLSHAATQQEGAALVLIDVQRFRNVNDTLGRHAGDEVLKALAARLAACVGEESSPAHVGPGVFAFIAKQVASEREAMGVAQRALEACFGTPISVNRNELRLAGRMGIALFPVDATAAAALYHNAEAALFKARKEGEAFLFYSADMTTRVAEKLTLESRLRHALEAQQFVLYYQPKVNARTGAVTSVEALIRWRTPEGALVAPGEFIPLLEETGLILPVGEWALHEAVRQYGAWRAQGLAAPRIAVNVSALQLRGRDFVAVLRGAAARASGGEHGLDLEITESVVMSNVADNIVKLSAAKEMGMCVSIDDFGTGYSSLRYVARLPLDALKIDGTFIVNMTASPEDMAIVSSIISLGRDLNLKVVAEGVETEEQAKLLRLLKCNEMQGFLFSRPLPAEGIASLLGLPQANVPAA